MRLAFLWHLHQPDYRDPATGIPVMPWARLHGLRGYRDLLVEALEEPVPWTLNVVPSLLDQLLHYAAGGSDPHLDLTRKPADALDEADVLELRAGFLGGHPALRRPFAALEGRIRASARPSVADLRDLQVWSTLTWFGATARRDAPILDVLRAKGHGFDEGDKADLLEVQQSFLAELPSLLKRVGETGAAGISCSAYHHPILPLVVDTGHAQRCLPGVPDVGFAYPEDARQQLSDARDRVEAVCGVRPEGLWPSEGSVSPEVVGLAAEAGFRWLCSDEGVLGRSEREGGGHGGWALAPGLTGFFRDTDLSDRIGFRYADTPAHDAVDDLLRAAAGRGAGQGVQVIALDGENPWETFADAGGAFRQALRSALSGRSAEGVRLDDVAGEAPVGRVHRIHTGSWIGADLGIWYGHEEDRRAWRALKAARDAASGHPREADALPHLHAAEGSDWYWWYGDDFRTPFAGRFDALFRAHLAAAWQALGEPVPEALERPLLDPDPVQITPPRAWLPRPLDGSWPPEAAAGRIGIPQGAMARGRAPELRFGWVLGDDGLPSALSLWLSGPGHRLVIDGRAVGEAQPTLAWQGPAGAVHVQVEGPEGPAWPRSIALDPSGGTASGAA